MITEYAISPDVDPESAHVDPDVLLTLQDLMEDNYPELVDTFLIDSQQRLSELRNTSQADDPDLHSISLAAHSFKGSSSNMGAVLLASLCSDLEQCAKQSACRDIKHLVGQIDLEFSAVRRVYERERERFSA